MMITSFDNSLVKRAIALHEKKGRVEHQQFIVEGVRAIEPFFVYGWKLYHLFITENMRGKVAANCPEHKIVTVSERIMKRLSVATTPSGMVAIFYIPQGPVPEILSPGLVLVQLQDPGNMGTLIRTAVALNKKMIVIVEGVEPWNPKVIQASAGTIAAAQIVQLGWKELIERKGSLRLCALVVRDGKKPSELDLKQSMLIIGSEAHGLPEAWQKQCDDLLTLAMPGGTESLNAAIAGSIALYCAYLQNVA